MYKPTNMNFIKLSFAFICCGISFGIQAQQREATTVPTDNGDHY